MFSWPGIEQLPLPVVTVQYFCSCILDTGLPAAKAERTELIRPIIDRFALIAPAIFLVGSAICLIFIYERRWRRNVVLRERERLALEIHDTLAQSFAGIAFQVQAVRADIPQGDPIRNQLDVVLQMVKRSHLEAKHSIATIWTPSIGSADIVGSLQHLGERISSGQPLHIQSSCQGRVSQIPESVANALLLIGREAILNSVRHSGATELDINLTVRNKVAQLTVSDNGYGFIVDPNKFGFGLRGVSSRAASISAKFEILSTPGTGTAISISKRISRLRLLQSAGWHWLKRFLRRACRC